jgi:hypothetical protein
MIVGTGDAVGCGLGCRLGEGRGVGLPFVFVVVGVGSGLGVVVGDVGGVGEGLESGVGDATSASPSLKVRGLGSTCGATLINECGRKKPASATAIQARPMIERRRRGMSRPFPACGTSP